MDAMIDRISDFVMQEDLSTYDPYDIWKTKIGFSIKALFNSHRYLALFPAALLSLLDLIFNPVMRMLYAKQEYPIVRAQAALALINLFKITRERCYLDKARLHIDWVASNYSTGYKGFGWGINFELPVDKNIIYSKNTPYATITPYCLEALVSFREASGSTDYDEYILGVFTFLESDIQVMIDGADTLATSYGPFKDRVVTNSVSYTMYSYALLIKFFPDLEGYIKNKVYRLYNFICLYQRKDGSWLYGPLDQGSFIDCFHSAFVLKNLIKTNELMTLDGCDEVIFKGFNYIEENMKDKSSGLYRRFSFSNKPGLAKYDLYDNAEMMNILVLLGRQEKARELEKAIDFAFFRGEDVYSMVDIFGFKRNKNTLRWAVMPYLLSRSSFSYE